MITDRFKWKLKFKPEKAHAIVLKVPQLYVNNQKVTRSENIIFLGVIFSKKPKYIDNVIYAFPAWANVSSLQMERIRMFERKRISNISNSLLYSQEDIIRIVSHMSNLELNTIPQMAGYRPPCVIQILQNRNQLFKGAAPNLLSPTQ